MEKKRGEYLVLVFVALLLLIFIGGRFTGNVISGDEVLENGYLLYKFSDVAEKGIIIRNADATDDGGILKLQTNTPDSRIRFDFSPQLDAENFDALEIVMETETPSENDYIQVFWSEGGAVPGENVASESTSNTHKKRTAGGKKNQAQTPPP